MKSRRLDLSLTRVLGWQEGLMTDKYHYSRRLAQIGMTVVRSIETIPHHVQPYPLNYY